MQGALRSSSPQRNASRRSRDNTCNTLQASKLDMIVREAAWSKGKRRKELHRGSPSRTKPLNRHTFVTLPGLSNFVRLPGFNV